MKLEDWIIFHEFATKSAALLLKLVLNKDTSVPIDIQVKTVAECFGLTNGTTDDEVIWQLKQIIPNGERKIR